MSAEPTSSALAGDRISFRSIRNPYEGYQEKRRRDALQRQKAARLQSANRARSLALNPDQQENEISEHECDGAGTTLENADADMDAFNIGSGAMAQSTGKNGSRSQRKHQRQQGSGGVRAYGLQYGNELMQPEWMTDVPPDLGANWLVMPRPEGMRCLLVTSRGRTVSWLRNGAPLHRFHSPLPGGSPATAAGCGAAAATAAGGNYCILDCVFHPANNTYYIQDLLCWRGYALYDCPAEFRTFWLANKLHEEGLAAGPGVMPGLAAPSTLGTAQAGSPGLEVSTPPGLQAPERLQQGPGCRDPLDLPEERNSADEQAVVDVEMGDGHVSQAGAGSSSGPGRQRRGRKQGGQQQEQQPASISYRIVPLPVYPCNLQGLQAAYGSGQPHPQPSADGSAASAHSAAVQAPAGPASACAAGPGGPGPPESSIAGAGAAGADVDFLRDGLYLLHRQGHYMPGPAATPLALLWKDLGCSRYLVDTDSNAMPLEHQLTVLVYRSDRTVATEDDPPVVLGRLPEAFVAAMGEKLKPGRLLRFSIRQGGIIFHEGRPSGADLHYEGLANQRRGRADTFSKVMFQRLARTQPITLSSLVAAAGRQLEAQDDVELSDGPC